MACHGPSAGVRRRHACRHRSRTSRIPATARAGLNIRFNDRHTGASLTAWLRAALAQHAERFELDVSISGESFLTEPGGAVEILRLQRAGKGAQDQGDYLRGRPVAAGTCLQKEAPCS